MLKTTLKTMATVALMTASITSFAGHLSVSKEVTVNASPDTTWKMIGDFNHLDVWHPVVVASKIVKGHDNKKGAERLLTLGNGANITEKLVDRSDKSQSYTYQIVKSPLPVSGYESTISVKSGMDGKSIVSWTSSFDAAGASDKEAVDTISGIYDAGLNNLDKHFNK